jgi:hypothetical protein
MADVALTTLLVKGPAANNEVGRGWTHKLEISYTDFLGVTSASDGDTVTVSCFTIPAYCIVKSVGFRLVTAFDDSGDGTTATMILGDDDDDNGFELARVIHVDATEVFIGANTGAYFIGTDSGSATTSNVIKGKTYTSAKTVKAVFTPTGFKMEESTQGKIVIFADILETNILISN